MKSKTLLIALALCATAGAASADCTPEITAVEAATEQMLNICAADGSSADCILATQEVELASASLEQCIFRETHGQPIGG